jgi:hypothetical protein
MSRPMHRTVRMRWLVTVLSSDGQRLVFHCELEDRTEVRAIATEARASTPGGLALQIWIRDPFGELSAWD